MRVNKSKQHANGAKQQLGILESLGANKTVYRLKRPIIPIDLKLQGDDLEGFDPYNSSLGKGTS